MGTYNIPRNTKGEGKILIIFSIKAFIYTIIGAVLRNTYKAGTGQNGNHVGRICDLWTLCNFWVYNSNL